MQRVLSGAMVAQGAVVYFVLLHCHSCRSQPLNALVASFQKGHFRQFIDCTHTASSVSMLHLSLKKETLVTKTHLKMCLCRKTSMDIIMFIRHYLLIQNQQPWES